MKNFIFTILFLFSSSLLYGQTTADLFAAVKNNDLSRTRSLVEGGLSANIFDEDGASLLMWAVYKGDLELVNYLVEAGSLVENTGSLSVKAKPFPYENLQGIAAGEGHLDILKYLVEDLKLDIDEGGFIFDDKIPLTPFALGCMYDKFEVVTFLYQLGVKTDFGIYMLLSRDNFVILDGLFDLGLNPNIKVWEKALIDIAIEQDAKNIIFYLKNPDLQHSLIKWKKLDQTVILYDEMGDVDNAIKCAKKVVVFSEKELPNTTFHVQSLDFLIYLYELKRNFIATESLHLEIIRIQKETIGENHPDYAMSLNYLASIYILTGEYLLSEDLFIEALNIQKVTIGEKHPDYTSSLGKLALLYSQQNNYLAAEPLLVKTIKLQKISIGENHLDYASSLSSLADIYKSKGEYDKAEKLYKEVLEIVRKNSTKKSSQYVQALYDLANLYFSKEEYTSAEFLMTQSLKITKEISGEEHLDYARLLGKIAVLYANIGDYTKAETLLLQASATIQDILGNNHPEYIKCLNDLVVVRVSLGNYEEAETQLLQIIKISEEKSGNNTTRYSKYLNNLADLYRITGNYTKAKSLFLKSLEILEGTVGEENLDYTSSLNNLAVISVLTGNYLEAEFLYEKALMISEKLVGKNHSEYAIYLGNLAELYMIIGDYGIAKEMYLKVSEIFKVTLGESHPTYATSLNNLSILNQSMGNYTEAATLSLKVLKIREEILGNKHTDYAISLNNTAVLYDLIEEYEAAEIMLIQATKILEETVGNMHPQYATSINNLAAIRILTGNYLEAELLFLEALQIRKNVLGETHPHYAKSLREISRLYSNTGEFQKAFQNANQRNNIEILNLRRDFTFLSESQKTAYFKNKHDLMSNSASLMIAYPKEEVISENYNIALIEKELLFQSNQTWKNLLSEKKNTTLNNIYTEWQFLSAARNKQLSLPISQRTNITDLEDKIAKLEKQILKLLPEYRQALENLNVTWQEVKNNLSKDAATIEFIRFDYYNKDWTDTTYYAALILRPEYTHPEMVLLGTEKELNQILSVANKEGIKPLYARSVDKSKEASSGGNYGAALYDFMWSKTDSLLAGVETVYYSPAGNLHRVAFAGIPLPDDAGYLGEKYALHCLGTTRQVVSGISNPLAPKDGEWLLAGGINYAAEPMQLAGVQTDTSVFTFNPTAYVADRSGREGLPYLPGTLEEVKAISDILQDKNTGIAHKVLTENQAVEEYFHDGKNFKNTSVLHIGSHGYFNSAPQSATEHQEHKLMQLDDSPYHQVDRPLLRSGLFLSGSNKAWTTSENYPGRMDGIWTAQEITELNLRHLKLATLSACETALGDIEGNEGVFGLQRAFKAAGVEKMLVSLWKVDDAATSLYMRTFYENWLSGGGIYEAYRATQEEMKTHEEYGNPYYWAGFVLLE